MFDRLRALATLKAADNSNNNAIENVDLDETAGAASALTQVQKRKFTVDRHNLPATLNLLFSPSSPLISDSRSFEFAYTEELGTGLGPTHEFYALGSEYFAKSEFVLKTPLGLAPNYALDTVSHFFSLGAFCARALIDDRIVDIPLHPGLLLPNANVSLQNVDEELYSNLSRPFTADLKEALLEFPDWSGRSGQLIETPTDWLEYSQSVQERVVESFNKAREAFTAGFNAASPTSLCALARLFPGPDLGDLFCPRDGPWLVDAVSSSLIPDHGYHRESVQLRWLAEIICELGQESRERRRSLLRFLTGAIYLPVGGWPALKLTIVSKSDDGIANSNANSPATSNASNLTNSKCTQDAYLPSVMTCANYLKLPRYSGKEVMRERLCYAIAEGNNSFYLS